jgi:uncharacterized membrane protein YhaH (DUF805 family)
MGSRSWDRNMPKLANANAQISRIFRSRGNRRLYFLVAALWVVIAFIYAVSALHGAPCSISETSVDCFASGGTEEYAAMQLRLIAMVIAPPVALPIVITAVIYSVAILRTAASWVSAGYREH